jgi:hypothetical protein
MRCAVTVASAVVVAAGLFGAGFLVGGASREATGTPPAQHSDRRFTISTRLVKVPNSPPSPLHQVFKILRSLGLGVGDLTAQANGWERGTVVRQGNAPGRSVPLGMEIPLILSAGPHPAAFQLEGRGSVVVGGTCDLVGPYPPSQPCIGGPLVVPLVPQ